MKRNIFFIICLSILASNAVMAQNFISREEAYNSVKAAGLVDTLKYNVQASQVIISAQTIIKIWTDSIISPDTDSWLFFIDKDPDASWTHPCTYVFVDAVNSSLTIIEENRRISLYMDILLYQESQFDLPPADFNIKKNDDPDNMKLKSTQLFHEKKYAILINGGWDQDNNNLRYWNNLSMMFKLLIEKGYLHENIYVLSSDGTSMYADVNFNNNGKIDHKTQDLDLDGDGFNDITYSAKRKNISLVFSEVAGKIAEDKANLAHSNVFIYVTDHGENTNNTPSGSRIVLWGEYMTTSQFLTELDKIRWDANFIQILMDQCNSGGFADVIESKNYNCLITTSCAYNQPAYGKEDHYGYFPYQWVCAMRGKNFHGIDITSVVDTDKDGFISFEEAGEYAKQSVKTFMMTSQYYSNPPDLGKFIAIDQIKTEAYCNNGKQDNGEGGIDCGGRCNKKCIVIVEPPETCNDGIMNQDETGIDCGGSNCPPCGIGGNLSSVVSNTGCDCGDQKIPEINSSPFFSGLNIFNVDNIKLSHGLYRYTVSTSYNPLYRCRNLTYKIRYDSHLQGGIFFEEAGTKFSPDKVYRISLNYWPYTYGAKKQSMHIKLANGLVDSSTKSSSSNNITYTSSNKSLPEIKDSFYVGFFQNMGAGYGCKYYDDDDDYRYSELNFTFQPDGYYDQLWLYQIDANYAYSNLNSIKIEELCFPEVVYSDKSPTIHNPTRASNAIFIQDFNYSPVETVQFMASNYIVIKDNTKISPAMNGSLILSIDKNLCQENIVNLNSPIDDQYFITNDKSEILFDLTNNEVKIFPNPTTDIIYIENSCPEVYTVSIYDFSGRLMKTIPQCEGSINVQLSDFPKGIYAFEVNSQSIHEIKKVIKK